MTNEELLEKAKLDYPIGTVFELFMTYTKLTITENNHRYFDSKNDNIIVSTDKGNGKTITNGASVYYQGKWAEIISKPETEWVPKVGEWIYAKGNILGYDHQIVRVDEVHTSNASGWYCKCKFKKNDGMIKDINTECSKNDSSIRPALPHEIPQQEEKVEYVEIVNKDCIYGGWQKYFSIGKIYSVKSCDKNSYIVNDSGGKTEWFISKTCAKPSTKEAYLAQEREKVKPRIEIKMEFNCQEELINKVSQLNKKQNEHSKEDSQIKKNLDTDTGASTGQSVRLRRDVGRIKCEGGPKQVGKEITRTRTTRSKPKAETGKRNF